jgi:peptidoglycan endopeptidase LytF
MTRRDVIIVSVLVNAGLLSVLFLTAQKSGPDIAVVEINEQIPQLTQQEEVVLPNPQTPMVELDHPVAMLEPPTQTVDELDNVLKEYLPEAPIETVAVALPKEPKPQPPQGEMIEVTVKKGDVLEKIARNNHTTIDAIKKANGLTNDKLKVGQKLKIPVNSKPPKTSQPIAEVTRTPVDVEPVYYTIKAGDNPWKIAKQFHVKFEDLLKWNNLNEDSGKNLKVGDKIRVK